MSNAARKARRQADRAKAQGEGGPCLVERCGANGPIGQSCELCAKKGKEFTLHACRAHAGEARARMKRHVLTKHPGALPAWMAAALSGQDMT